jgi:hypothetical protein
MKMTLRALAANSGGLRASESAESEKPGLAIRDSLFSKYPSAREPKPKLERAKNSRREVTVI